MGDTIAPYGYLFGGLILLGFIGYIATLAGPSIIENAPQPPEFPHSGLTGNALIDWLLQGVNAINYGFQFLQYFFTLMTISSPFAIFGIIILIPFTAIVAVMIIQLIGALKQ